MSKSRVGSIHDQLHCKVLFIALTLLFTVAVVSSQMRYGVQKNPIGIRSQIPLEIVEKQNLVQEQQNLVEDEQNLVIQDVIALPDGEFLLLARTTELRSSTRTRSLINGSCKLKFGGKKTKKAISGQIQGIGSIGEGRRSIRCRISPQQSLLIPSETNNGSLVDVKLQSSAGRILGETAKLPLLFWNRLVFESLVTDQDVVLFTKGILPARKEDQEKAMIRDTKCIFLDASSRILAETEVLSLSQEIVRCRHPPEHLRSQLLGNKMSLRTPKSRTAPSAVFYDRPRIQAAAQEDPEDDNLAENLRKRNSLCACTMVYNAAKFLREWIQYHSHLGIEKFFLYDNNSNDLLEETVQELNREGSATVTTRAWPWIKTQEAGFSHCALDAKSDCEWMAFVDVDEFIFPTAWIEQEEGGGEAESGGSATAVDPSILSQVINDVTSPARNRSANAGGQIGQISFHCRDFGPSGQTRNPAAGVTQGYTCRVAKEQRHKSLVRLEALDRTLVNVIHHFKLSPPFSSVTIPATKGVVNHYKYQAWEEFKQKFRRRVSAYVIDWKESKNSKSQDRTPGLGNEAVKPQTWERQFCEVEDTALQRYVSKVLKPSSI